jgi:hypothetical protein
MWRTVIDNNVIEKIEPYVRHNIKKIEVYKNDVLIDSFYSISEAAKKMKRSRCAISKYISGTTLDKKNYIWKDITKPILENNSNPINAKTIFCYDSNNVLINSYYSIYNASKLTGFDRTKINRYLRDGKDENNNIWKKIVIRKDLFKPIYEEKINF